MGAMPPRTHNGPLCGSRNQTVLLSLNSRTFVAGASMSNDSSSLALMPLLGRDLPDFRRQSAGNEVSLFGGHDAHSLSFRNAARGLVGHRLGRSEDRKFQNVEPIVGDHFAGFTHQAPPLPRQAEPESAIVIFRSHQADRADHTGRIALEPQGPVPFFSAFDRRKSDISAIRQSTIGWIGPRHPSGQKLHEFPVGEKNLNL